MTFFQGSKLNLYGDFTISGNAYFNAPHNIIVDGTKTLPQYIESISSGDDGVTAIGYAHTAHKIGTSASSFIDKGNATTPVYLKNGDFEECTAYPDFSSYATQEWVEDKKYLTSIPNDVVREDDISDFVTSSTTSLTNYVLTRTYESKIEELERIIGTLQGEIETLKK